MSLFSWFSRKSPAAVAGGNSELNRADATQPLSGAPDARHRAAASDPAGLLNRRTERLERRELLYSVVRECMTQSGVLSSKYKFKVLSLDSKGQEYLVMMDIPKEHAVESHRLTEIEGLIARNAKNRHDIMVTAVYWRVVEQVVTVALDPQNTQASPPSPVVSVTPVPPVAPQPSVPVSSSTQRFDPIQAEEVEAFKKALASAPVADTSKAKGELVRSGRRNPVPMPHFADTVIDDSHSPLSGTQYGELR